MRAARYTPAGRQGPRGRPWQLPAVGFAAPAVDERFAPHEQLRDGVLAPRGISVPFLPWVAPRRPLCHAHHRDRSGGAPRALGRPHRARALPTGRGTRRRVLMPREGGPVARPREAEAATGDASGSTGGFTFSCNTAPPTARDDRLLRPRSRREAGAPLVGRVHRHVLARPRWLRQRGAGRGRQGRRDRLPGGVARLRPDRPDDGVRARSHLRGALQPGRDAGAGPGSALRRAGSAPVRRDPGGGGDQRRGRAARDRKRQGGLQHLQRLRRQRLRHPLTWRLQPHRSAGGRDRAHRRIPDGDPRRHRPARTQGVRPARDRPGADADPPDQHPGGQHVGEPCAVDQPGDLRRWRGAEPALAVLARPARRGRDRRAGLPLPHRGERRRAGGDNRPGPGQRGHHGR